MCGIAGVLYRDGEREVTLETLAAMAKAIRHRGPDSEGRFAEGSVGLTMRRLVVIDKETGDQPIWNEDRTVAVIQNGEIYNFEDLRQELRGLGHIFSTASDTESIVHLYEETGPSTEFAARLWGMFAIALFDRKRQILVLARDRAGKKPLFLYRDASTLAFASEVRCFSAVSELRAGLAVDPLSLDAYLGLQYVPGPRSIFRNVAHLPPGSMMVLEKDSNGWQEHEPQRYWSLRGAASGRAPQGFAATVAQTEEILRDAVRRRLVSDVPLGVFLSGGLDSSLLVALMAQEVPGQVRTFSIGFEDPEYDESEVAAFVANHLNTEHKMLMMPTPGVEDLTRILGAFDQPLSDPAVLPTWYLSRMTRQDVTVALSGEGADEVFAGYHWYRRAKSWRSEAMRQGAEPWADYYRRRRQLSQSERLVLLADALRHEVLEQGVDAAGESYRDAAVDSAEFPPMAALQAADFSTWMADDLLPKVDRMSMAHSLEVRCPYLDHRLVEAVLPLADSSKVRWGRRKAVLRRIAAPYLPAAVVKRKKHGFKVPVDRLMRTAFRPLVQDLTSAERLKTQGLFSAQGVSALLRRWEDDPSLARHVWKIFCFQVWWEATGSRL